MAFLDRYTPVLGTEGEKEIELTDTTVYDLLPLPENVSACTIAANGGRVMYKVNGEDPSASYGRPIPDGDEIILTNLDMINNCKITREDDNCFAYIQYYRNG